MKEKIVEILKRHTKVGRIYESDCWDIASEICQEQEKEMEQLLHWIWKQGFAKMVQDYGMDGIVKKFIQQHSK